MPPAATCCLLQTTRQHYRRRLIRDGNRRFLTPFCSMRTVEFSTKLWVAWISLNCGGQFWPTSPPIISASMNTGRVGPAGGGPKEGGREKDCPQAPQTTTSSPRETSLSPQLRNSTRRTDTEVTSQPSPSAIRLCLKCELFPAMSAFAISDGIVTTSRSLLF